MVLLLTAANSTSFEAYGFHSEKLPLIGPAQMGKRRDSSTPQTSTKTSPATALFGRPVKTRLPQIGKELESHDDVVCENDDRAKLKRKYYAEKKSYVKPSLLEKGDTVLLKNNHKSKRFSPYDPRPYEVVGKKGSMVTARSDSTSVTRNSSFFKPIVKAENEESECPGPSVAERSQENLDVPADTGCKTRENPDVSEGDERETSHEETPCTETVMSRYATRIRKKTDIKVVHIRKTVLENS